jgi:hypothetical protein
MFGRDTVSEIHEVSALGARPSRWPRPSTHRGATERPPNSSENALCYMCGLHEYPLPAARNGHHRRSKLDGRSEISGSPSSRGGRPQLSSDGPATAVGATKMLFSFQELNFGGLHISSTCSTAHSEKTVQKPVSFERLDNCAPLLLFRARSPLSVRRDRSH